MSDKTRARCFPADKRVTTELGSKAAEGAGVGALTGGRLGALLAGLAAAGVAVPLLPMIAIGPLAAAVAGGATGGVAGAIRWRARGRRHSGGASENLRSWHRGGQHRDGRNASQRRGCRVHRARMVGRPQASRSYWPAHEEAGSRR